MYHLYIKKNPLSIELEFNNTIFYLKNIKNIKKGITKFSKQIKKQDIKQKSAREIVMYK